MRRAEGVKTRLDSKPQSGSPSILLWLLCAALGLSVGCSADDASDGASSEMPPESSADAGGEPTDDGQEPTIAPGQLTAAEWRDLDNWSFWLGLFEVSDPGERIDGPVGILDPPVNETWRELESHWQSCTRVRFPVSVSYDGAPAVDVALELYGEGQDPLWRARTDVAGRGELFAGYVGDDCGTEEGLPVNPSLIVRDDEGDVIWEGGVTPGEPRFEIELPEAQTADYTLDLMFLVDTTGSMGDELSYLQAEIGDVIERVRDNASANLSIRVSLGFYRDEGDDYVVRMFGFTTEVDEALTNLSRQSANGGGDFPEAVHSALREAVHEQSWSDSATARLLFLVLDAPPHDTEPVRQQLATTIPVAAAEGIRVIPLAGSGYDIVTEYLTRSWAIVTGGTFLFLTDDSGIGNSHREPTVGDYEVELLNDLLVRVIGEYLSAEASP